MDIKQGLGFDIEKKEVEYISYKLVDYKKYRFSRYRKNFYYNTSLSLSQTIPFQCKQKDKEFINIIFALKAINCIPDIQSLICQFLGLSALEINFVRKCYFDLQREILVNSHIAWQVNQVNNIESLFSSFYKKNNIDKEEKEKKQHHEQEPKQKQQESEQQQQIKTNFLSHLSVSNSSHPIFPLSYSSIIGYQIKKKEQHHEQEPKQEQQEIKTNSLSNVSFSYSSHPLLPLSYSSLIGYQSKKKERTVKAQSYRIKKKPTPRKPKKEYRSNRSVKELEWPDEMFEECTYWFKEEIRSNEPNLYYYRDYYNDYGYNSDYDDY